MLVSQAGIVAAVIFVIVQTGGLIWFLSRINSEVKQMRLEIAASMISRADIGHTILNHERRITRIEATCQYVDCKINGDGKP